MTATRQVMVIGYGNPGRLDDGLGPALAARLAARGVAGVTIDSDYQLSIEHAAAAAEHDVLIFVDAALNGPEPFSFSRLAPGSPASFTTHSVSPGGVLALAGELFGGALEAYVLGIRGYAFDEFGQRLSEQAERNLAAAEAFLVERIEQLDYSQAADRAASASDSAAVQ